LNGYIRNNTPEEGEKKMNIPLIWVCGIAVLSGMGFGCLLQTCYEYMRRKSKRNKKLDGT